MGHKAGAETFRRIATYCKNLGIRYLTVYAFSTENWKRSADEVGAIMGLLKKYLLEAVDTMEREGYPSALLRRHDTHRRRSCGPWPGRRTRSPSIWTSMIFRPTSV
jgi:undecaprenyl pyrophosphate synthase